MKFFYLSEFGQFRQAQLKIVRGQVHEAISKRSVFTEERCEKKWKRVWQSKVDDKKWVFIVLRGYFDNFFPLFYKERVGEVFDHRALEIWDNDVTFELLRSPNSDD